jgi:hypothetical protein
MALVYAADFNFLDTVTGGPAELWTPVEIARSWAEQSAALVNEESFAEDSARNLHAAFRLTFTRADSQQPDVMWVVTTTMVQGVAGLTVGVRNERFRLGPVGPVKSNPKPPRLVRMLLEDPRIHAVDAGRPVLADFWSVGPIEAEAFATFLVSPERRLPVIGFTPREDDVVDASELVKATEGLAHVVLLSTDATWALDRLLPRGYNVYGGAVRIWWPGLGPQSNRWDHRLWPGDVRPASVYAEVEDLVRQAAVAAPTTEPSYSEQEQRRNQLRLNDLRARASDAQESMSATLANADAAVRAVTENLTADLNSAMDLAAEAEARCESLKEEYKEAKQRIQQLLNERDAYRHQLTVRNGDARTDATAEDDFCADVSAELSQLGAVKAHEFALGPDFMNRIESLGTRYRSKAVRTCSAVASGIQEHLARVEDHPLRTADAGSSPQRVRSADGALARRASLEQGAPSARRLHYWVLENRTLEFASVNVHDDMTIP